MRSSISSWWTHREDLGGRLEAPAAACLHAAVAHAMWAHGRAVDVGRGHDAVARLPIRRQRTRGTRAHRRGHHETTANIARGEHLVSGVSAISEPSVHMSLKVRALCLGRISSSIWQWLSLSACYPHPHPAHPSICASVVHVPLHAAPRRPAPLWRRLCLCCRCGCELWHCLGRRSPARRGGGPAWRLRGQWQVLAPGELACAGEGRGQGRQGLCGGWVGWD